MRTAAGVPVGPVQDLAAALADPLTAERRLVADAEPGRLPGLQQLHLPLDRAREAPRRQAPAVGEHTVEVLSSIGLSDAEIAEATGRAPSPLLSSSTADRGATT